MSIYSFFKNLFSKPNIETTTPVFVPQVQVVEEVKPTLEEIVAKEVVTPAPAKKAVVRKTQKPKVVAKTAPKKKK